MPKMDSLTVFLYINVYNDVLMVHNNGSKVTALYVFNHFNVCTTLKLNKFKNIIMCHDFCTVKISINSSFISLELHMARFTRVHDEFVRVELSSYMAWLKKPPSPSMFS